MKFWIVFAAWLVSAGSAFAFAPPPESWVVAMCTASNNLPFSVVTATTLKEREWFDPFELEAVRVDRGFKKSFISQDGTVRFFSNFDAFTRARASSIEIWADSLDYERMNLPNPRRGTTVEFISGAPKGEPDRFIVTLGNPADAGRLYRLMHIQPDAKGLKMLVGLSNRDFGYLKRGDETVRITCSPKLCRLQYQGPCNPGH